ncbi:hypothetical protein G6F62_008904 [Rhizopus arrhizus]|nr:hypothetical protein G6F23_009820 [Rhizopus arrhizus]KAG1324779.1 hypothetical protein G6F62_008904 [Rhizopus arrhizus]KAG1380483.1 hypothetical protein G6F61_004010 [Rhizopus arrhizus]KAG1404730.1 hypothetical protein G6F60_004117 [Rhizopus arrhizus]
MANLGWKFDDGTIFVMGSWSSPNSGFYEPIRGVGFQRRLQKNGFRVLLMDELQTNKCCSHCEEMILKTLSNGTESSSLEKTCPPSGDSTRPIKTYKPTLPSACG